MVKRPLILNKSVDLLRVVERTPVTNKLSEQNIPSVLLIYSNYSILSRSKPDQKPGPLIHFK